MTTFKINGEMRTVASASETPLLYVLRSELNVTTPKFGCGLAQCGACSVLVDGQEVRSCELPIGEAAGKEVTTVEGLARAFDEGAITATDWTGYPILTMAQMPELKIVLVPRPETGVFGQGSESANALAAPAITAAVFDATGKLPRRLPLRADYVKAMLNA